MTGTMQLNLAGAVLVTMCLVFITGSVEAKEYILTGLKPDKLALVDTKARKLARTYVVPDAGPGPLTITPAPDGSRAYALVNRWESVSGIDLDSGKQVFRANFSGGGRRVKGMFGMDVSPDGNEIAVFQSPVKLDPGEYRVEDTYIAIYDTGDGIDAKPVRTFPAPRRTAILTYSTDGKKLYAIGWDIVIYDPRTGKQLGVHPIRNWQRANFTEPDVLDVWPQWEQAQVFSTPYFTVATDKAEDDPAAYRMGMATLDLNNDKFVMNEYENFAVIIFSTVVNPVRRNEVFGTYTQLSKIDIAENKLVNRIDLDHTYYAINISSDGKELYVGGTMDDIAIYDSETLKKIGSIKFPGGEDMALSSLRIINR
ncbi:MAG: quinohemoprotein amine dehydrogenase subunit beta [Gammaproteobacteria bacterium]|nr:quinohemoprotein amine dehydrogenase subunit beta [Gammaproteobacteria bacterium]